MRRLIRLTVTSSSSSYDDVNLNFANLRSFFFKAPTHRTLTGERRRREGEEGWQWHGTRSKRFSGEGGRE